MLACELHLLQSRLAIPSEVYGMAEYFFFAYELTHALITLVGSFSPSLMKHSISSYQCACLSSPTASLGVICTC